MAKRQSEPDAVESLAREIYARLVTSAISETKGREYWADKAQQDARAFYESINKQTEG